MPLTLPQLAKLSSVRIYLPKDLRPSDSKHSVKKSIAEVQKRFPDGLPLLDPVKDMHITQEEFKKIVRKIESLESRMFASSAHKMEDLEQQYNLCGEKMEVGHCLLVEHHIIVCC